MRRKNFSSGKSESKERGGANGEKPRRRMLQTEKPQVKKQVVVEKIKKEDWAEAVIREKLL